MPRAMASKSKLAKVLGVTMSLAPLSFTQKPTSRSRKMCSIGFWTAPRRLIAATSTIDSSQVGSCQVITSPAPIPNSAKPAAARSARVLYSPNVISRPLSSTAMRASGVASARFSISSHSVRPSSISSPCSPVGRF